MNDEQVIESEIVAKGLTAPRLTPAQIDAAIKKTTIYIHERVLTIAVVELQNGFFVTGESACASPENFDADIGAKIAFENARQKIWALEGYVLRNAVAQRKAHAERVLARQAQAGVLKNIAITAIDNAVADPFRAR